MVHSALLLTSSLYLEVLFKLCYTCTYEAQKGHASHSLIPWRWNNQLERDPLSIESKLRDAARS
jgi:hypothetical protein